MFKDLSALFTVWLSKSILATASSSFITISTLSGPIPVEITVNLFANITCVRVKLAMMQSVFNAVEIFAYGINPVGVPNGNNSIGQFFGPHVYMINSSPAVNDQF